TLTSADDGSGRGERRAARAGHVEVRYQRERRNFPLLLAQRGAFANGGDEPVTELRRGLDNAAADEIRVRIGEVRRDREQAADRHGLLLEDAARERVALLAVGAHELGRIGQRYPREFVFGMALQPVR